MAKREWTCRSCRRVLGVIRHRGADRRTRLVTTIHVRSVEASGPHPVIRCICGATRSASGLDIYFTSSATT
jgi:hypothetical protein